MAGSCAGCFVQSLFQFSVITSSLSHLGMQTSVFNLKKERRKEKKAASISVLCVTVVQNVGHMQHRGDGAGRNAGVCASLCLENST